jgi:hypothetical protein
MAEKNDKRMAEPYDSPNKGGRWQKPLNNRDMLEEDKEETTVGMAEINFDQFRCGADRSTPPSQAEQVQEGSILMDGDSFSETEHSSTSEATQLSEEEVWDISQRVKNGTGYLDDCDAAGRADFEKDVPEESFSLKPGRKSEPERSLIPTIANLKRWISALIRMAWEVAWDLWEYRNGIKHDSKNHLQLQYTASLELRIRQTAPQKLEQPAASRIRGGRSLLETLSRVGEGEAWGDQLRNKGPDTLRIGVINVNGLEALLNL